METITERLLVTLVVGGLAYVVGYFWPPRRGNTALDRVELGKADRKEGERSISSLLAETNAGMKWSKFEVMLGENDSIYVNRMRVPVPIWNYWVLQDNETLRREMQTQFLRTLEGIGRDYAIYPTSMPALRFLREIQREINDQNGHLYTFREKDRDIQAMRHRPLILFDLSFSSGRTLAQSARFFDQHGWAVQHMVVLVENDLIHRESPLEIFPEYAYYNVVRNKLVSLCKASQIVNEWADAALISELDIIVKAIRGEYGWGRHEVKSAVRYIYQNVKPENFLAHNEEFSMARM
jgi:hypothetical protein